MKSILDESVFYQPQQPGSDRCARFLLCDRSVEPRWSTCRRMAKTAPHGGVDSDACAHGGDMSSRASQRPCPQPPTTASTRWRLVQSTTDRAGEAANKAPRRQKSKAARETVFFELFDEDTAGMWPGVLAEPWPQERVQRHTMEHIVDYVCGAPLVQILDAPVPQTVEQLPDVLQFFDTLTTDPEQVIAVPKILLEDVPVRAVLRDPQLVEQLVEVLTTFSYAALLLWHAWIQAADCGAER